MFIVSILLFSSFLIVNLFLDWTHILNTESGLKSELNYVVLIAVFFYAFRLAINPINVILVAQQKPAISTDLKF